MTTHETLVASQFGPQAAAYVASAVHAQGEDLVQMAAAVTGMAQARVLDLGCGGGHVSFNVAPHVREVVAYDLSHNMLGAVAATAAAKGLGNIATQHGRVEALPFADAAFDVVMSRFSAHHWHGFAAALREARRVIKPGGRAVLADAISPGPALLDTFVQAIELLRDPSHVRDYTIAEWTRALADSGFRVDLVTRRRLRLEFGSWIARMRTPEVHAQAIRSLQARMAREVAEHFALEADGSFMLDTATIEATAA